MYNGGFGAYPSDDMGMGVNSYFGESDTNFFGDTSNDSFFSEGAGFAFDSDNSFFGESVDMNTFGSDFFSEGASGTPYDDFELYKKATPTSKGGASAKKIGGSGSSVRRTSGTRIEPHEVRPDTGYAKPKYATPKNSGKPIYEVSPKNSRKGLTDITNATITWADDPDDED